MTSPNINQWLASQVEPAGRGHRDPLGGRNCAGGDGERPDPHQPHHHPRHEGDEDRPG